MYEALSTWSHSDRQRSAARVRSAQWASAPAHWSSTRKKEWVEAVRHRTEVYSSVEVRNLTVHLQGTLAVVTGEYSQTGTKNGKDISSTGIYADTWLKRNGHWVVIDSVFP